MNKMTQKYFKESYTYEFYYPLSKKHMQLSKLYEQNGKNPYKTLQYYLNNTKNKDLREYLTLIALMVRHQCCREVPFKDVAHITALALMEKPDVIPSALSKNDYGGLELINIDTPFWTKTLFENDYRLVYSKFSTIVMADKLYLGVKGLYKKRRYTGESDIIDKGVLLNPKSFEINSEIKIIFECYL